MSLRAIFRLPLCWMQMCPFEQREGPTGVWGECVHCGKVEGFVSRADLRSYAEREVVLQDLINKGFCEIVKRIER